MAQARTSLLRNLLANVFLLSAAYLAAGLVLEVLRRFLELSWAARLLTALDGLPARTLALVGLLAPLQEAYGRGAVSTWQLRAIFSAATLGVIAVTAVVVGATMACLQWVWERRAKA